MPLINSDFCSSRHRIRLGYGTASAIGIYGNTYKWDDLGREVVKSRYRTQNTDEMALGHQGTLDLPNLQKVLAEKRKPKVEVRKGGVMTDNEIAAKMALELRQGIENTKKELAR